MSVKLKDGNLYDVRASSLNLTDLVGLYDGDGKTMVAGTFNTLGKMRIPVGTKIGIGNGDSANLGIIYAKFQDATPAELASKIRVNILPPAEGSKTRVLEYVNTEVNVTKTDKQTAKFLPPKADAVAHENWIIEVEIMPISSNLVLSKANSDVVLPVTIFEKVSGN